MSGKSVIEDLLSRDRLITGSAIAAIFLIAAVYTILGVGMPMSALKMTTMSGAVPGALEGQSLHAAGMLMPAVWSTTYAMLVFLMWWIMMIAMMLPSVAPTVLLYGALIRRGNESEDAPRYALYFVFGYLFSWALFSLLATIAQWLLELRGLVSPSTMTLTSHLIAGGVLVLAGIYQFTPWKHACLEHCRTPLQFLTERRRSGPNGALLMGLEHGTFCLGCCWVLMALLLVGGIMNLYWIAGLTFFVVVEKLVKHGDKISYVTGVLMAGTGTYLLVSAG
ncbi:MAG: DUF2182 domain-containing protein [Arenicellales bacterium]|nr:DUF2182 domain-containing protein [Arenicellales bacterium]